MIVTRTPLRISFFGGGSDLPAYYNNSPGLVVSAAINRHIQIAVNKCEPKHIRVVYSELEQASTVEKIKHTRAKAVLNHFGIKSNIEIASFSDITTRGSGLGSSSSYTVGLINAMYNMLKLGYTKKDLAEDACTIEIHRLGEPIGKQDQYAASYGGINAIHFYNDGVDVVPIGLNHSHLADLNDNLLCYSTGISRDASSVLEGQVKNLISNSDTIPNTKVLVDLAEQSINYLRIGKLDDFGVMLDEGWKIKRKLAPGITNELIDIMYDTAKAAGAFGGKLLGAGGGGFMIFYVSPKNRDSVRVKMKDYKQFHFKFTDNGSMAVEV